MSSLTWLHLSDWHQKGKDLDINRGKVLKHLIDDIRERTKITKNQDLATIDFVVFSGDVAFHGTREEYEAATKRFFDPVLNAAGVAPDCLFIVPGNHDLNRNGIKYLPPELQRPLESKEMVEEWLGDPVGRNCLLFPFEAYEGFVGEYVGQPQKAYAYLRQLEVRGKRITLIGLNSALLSGRNKKGSGSKKEVDDDRHLILSELQIHKLLNNEMFRTADVRIALMHHPFDWLARFDQELVERQLRAACHFILQGHEHRPGLERKIGPIGDCVVIPAGPSYDRREPKISECANSYNYVHLDFATSQGTVYFRRYEDRQGWIIDVGTTGSETPGYHTFTLPKGLGKSEEPRKFLVQKPPVEQEQTDRPQQKEESVCINQREDYRKAVREQSRTLKIRGLAPQATGGATELDLPDVYVHMLLTEGLEQRRIYVARELESLMSAEIVGDIEEHAQERKHIGEMEGEAKKLTRFELIQSEKLPPEAARHIVDIWAALAPGLNVILGEAGAGKTVTVQYLTLALAGGISMEGGFPFGDYLPIKGNLAKFSERLGSGKYPDLDLKMHLCEDQFAEFSDLLEAELVTGNCVVLLDGLDETQDPRQVMDAIQDFAAHYKKNYIVVTSREDAYHRAGMVPSAKHLTIGPMSVERRDLFIDRWYRVRDGKGDVGANGLKKFLSDDPELAELATNPLLLTIIIQMHWCSITLPNKPVKLYEAMIETLVNYWRRSKYETAFQTRTGMENLDLDTQEILTILRRIAYEMLNGNGVIGESDLLGLLTEGVMQTKSWDHWRAEATSRQWLDLISEQSGLLIKSGIDKQTKKPIFEFSHRRFAEYLAALHLGDLAVHGTKGMLKHHIHKSQWNEVILLYVEVVGLQSSAAAAKVLRVIRSLNSPYEEIVWRDRFLAARCLGKGVLLVDDLPNVILGELVNLVTNRCRDLHIQAVSILKSLWKTPYRERTVKLISDLVRRDLPWHIKMTAVDILFELGEREQLVHELLVELREVAHRRGDSTRMAWAIQCLLKEWEDDTLEWLIEKGNQYGGRGLELEIGPDFSETMVAATDESFSSIPVGRQLTEATLREFIHRFTQVAPDHRREMAEWVQCQLDESVDGIRGLAIHGHRPRVRQLAAEWLVKHGARAIGIPVLTNLATEGEGDLLAVETLIRIGRHEEDAIHGARRTLATTLDLDHELKAAEFLAWLGDTKQVALVLVELLLSGELNSEYSHRVADFLWSGLNCEVGLAFLRVRAAEIRRTNRCDAAIAVGEAARASKTDEYVNEAYQALLDIAGRFGQSDRAGAIVALSDPRYATFLKEDQCDLNAMARRIIEEVADKYTAVTRLLRAGIVPKVSGDTEAIQVCDLISHKQWEERVQSLVSTLCQGTEEWLNSEQRLAQPYAQAALGYVLAKKRQKHDAIEALHKAASHPDASAGLLLRVGRKLLSLEAREAGLKALSQVPARCGNEAVGWLESAFVGNSPEEKEHALNATRKVADLASEFPLRREAAALFVRLEKADEGRKLLLGGIEREVPRRTNWLLGSHVDHFRKLLLDLADHILKHDPRYVRALTMKAEVLRRLEQYDEALDVVKQAIRIDKKYPEAWVVNGETLENKEQWHCAIAALEQATTLDPDYIWAWMFKANLLRQIGQYDDALISIGQAIDIDERFGQVWAVKMMTLEQMGRRDEAARLAGRLMKLEPDNAWARVFKAETLRRMGQYAEALKEVDKALEINKTYTFAWQVKSEILASMDRHDEALSMLARGLNTDDKYTKLSAITALADIGDSDAVGSLLVALGDQDADVRSVAAMALGRLADPRATDDLIRTFRADNDGTVRRAAIRAFSKSSDDRVGKALITALDDSDNQIREIAAQSLGPVADETILRKLAAMVLEDDQEIAGAAALGLASADNNIALALLEQAINERPHIAMLHSRLGILLRHLEKFEESLRAHNEAIKIEKSCGPFLASRALTHLARANYKDSVKDYKQAITLAPKWSGLWAGMACAQFEMGFDNEALNAWWRERSLSGGLTIVNAELGVGLYGMGHRHEALRLWRLVIAREPRFAGDWEWVRTREGWGPRMTKLAQEIIAALVMERAQSSSPQ
jgi:tetratricopeptide (TPR) repeat protein/predicted phosphodiesterase